MVDFLRGAEGPVVVWWFRKRANRDSVIKSVTGAGKSVVGLRAARPRKDFGCA